MRKRIRDLTFEEARAETEALREEREAADLEASFLFASEMAQDASEEVSNEQETSNTQ